MPRSFSRSMWSMVAPPPLVVHFLHAVDAAGVEQDPLAEGGLARVDVGRNADIAEFAQIHVRLVSRLRQGNMPLYNPLLYSSGRQMTTRVYVTIL